MVADWAPAAARDLLASGKVLIEVTEAVAEAVAAPVGPALQALGLPDVPLPDLGVVALSADVGPALAALLAGSVFTSWLRGTRASGSPTLGGRKRSSAAI